MRAIVAATALIGLTLGLTVHGETQSEGRQTESVIEQTQYWAKPGKARRFSNGGFTLATSAKRSDFRGARAPQARRFGNSPRCRVAN